MAYMVFANRELEQWWRQVATPDPRVSAQGEKLGKQYLACILVSPVDSNSARVAVFHDSGLAEDALESVAAESRQRVDSFLEVGPADEPYLWQLRSDGDYQVWLTGYDLPEI
jgi:hypothetical protein